MSAQPRIVIDLDLKELAKLIAAELRGHAPTAAAEPYDQNHLPPGESRGSYLEKARQGRFPVARLGRRIICKAADWEAFVESQRAAAQPKVRAARPRASEAARAAAVQEDVHEMWRAPRAKAK